MDTEGRLALPSDLLPYFGLEPGVQVRIDRRSSGLHLRQPVTYLGKVYVEPTNACNLDCRPCIHHQSIKGDCPMAMTTFHGLSVHPCSAYGK